MGLDPALDLDLLGAQLTMFVDAENVLRALRGAIGGVTKDGTVEVTLDARHSVKSRPWHKLCASICRTEPVRMRVTASTHPSAKALPTLACLAPGCGQKTILSRLRWSASLEAPTGDAQSLVTKLNPLVAESPTVESLDVPDSSDQRVAVLGSNLAHCYDKVPGLAERVARVSPSTVAKWNTTPLDVGLEMSGQITRLCKSPAMLARAQAAAGVSRAYGSDRLFAMVWREADQSLAVLCF